MGDEKKYVCALCEKESKKPLVFDFGGLDQKGLFISVPVCKTCFLQTMLKLECKEVKD